MKKTYKIMRNYMRAKRPEVMKTGLTLTEAKKWCKDPETSSRTCTNDDAIYRTEMYGPWFDGWTEE